MLSRSIFRLVNRVTTTAVRLQSTEAVATLASVFEDYREKNYAQTLPSRFAKEIVSAADADGDGKLTKDEIASVFANIGAGDAMSTAEIEEAVTSLAGSDGELSSSEFIDLLTGKK